MPHHIATTARQAARAAAAAANAVAEQRAQARHVGITADTHAENGNWTQAAAAYSQAYDLAMAGGLLADAEIYSARCGNAHVMCRVHGQPLPGMGA